MKPPPSVVLVRPQEEGNVGATARAMANMGLDCLILVEPAVSLGRVAYAFAVGAQSILRQVQRVSSLEEALSPFARVIGTTAGRQRSVDVTLLTPREVPKAVALDPPGTLTALVFGPENSGLTKSELARCGLLVQVPCSSEQPTLNLSQAVLIVAYELFQSGVLEASPAKAAPPPPPASASELDGLFGHMERVLHAVGFDRDDTYPGVARDLRQLLARASPSSREVSILRGICRRILGSQDRP